MILPDKHIRLSSSFLGAGAVLLELLESGRTVSGLWSATKQRQEIRTFERFTLILDMLYAWGLVKFDENGLLVRAAR